MKDRSRVSKMIRYDLTTTLLILSLSFRVVLVLSSSHSTIYRTIVDFPSDSTVYDAYEVRLSTSSLYSNQWITSTRVRTSPAIFDTVRPNVSYVASFRGHEKNGTSYAVGNWGPVRMIGDVFVERVVNSEVVEESRSKTIGIDDVFRIEVIRQSEFTEEEIDYLANHDSGDAFGDAAFLTVTSGDAANQSLINVSFYNSTFARYCVEIQRPRLSFATRSGNQSYFADYVSCNFGLAPTPTNPTCVCQCWADRNIANDPEQDACHRNGTSTNVPCSWDDLYDCTCPCGERGTNASERFTGYMPVYMSDEGIRQGSWYSHPASTECLFDSTIGDESGCTWKIVNDVRIVRGWDLLRHGFVIPDKNTNISKAIELNAEAIIHAFDAMPLTPFAC